MIILILVLSQMDTSTKPITSLSLNFSFKRFTLKKKAGLLVQNFLLVLNLQRKNLQQNCINFWNIFSEWCLKNSKLRFLFENSETVITCIIFQQNPLLLIYKYEQYWVFILSRFTSAGYVLNLHPWTELKPLNFHSLFNCSSK